MSRALNELEKERNEFMRKNDLVSDEIIFESS